MPETIIELNGVNIFRKDVLILKDVTWKITEDENWAVVGGNGAGKSYLLNVISANLHPSSGAVRIMNKELGRTNVWELRKHIGLVNEELIRKYPDTSLCLEVVCSGFFSSIGLYRDVDEGMKEIAFESMKKLCIEHLAERKLGELSQGERKKMFIARCLVSDPKLLVLDEPSTGLDIPSKESFLDMVNDLAESGHTLVYVTHQIDEIIPAFNRVLLLKSGRVTASGPKEEVMQEHLLTEALGYRFRLLNRYGRYWPVLFDE